MLRAAGLHVTAVHELRLQTVFRTFSDVPEERVVRLVAPVVMSAPEELEIVEDVVARWLPEVAALRFVGPTGELALVQPAETRAAVHQAAAEYTASKPTRRLWPLIAAGVAAAGVTVVALWRPPPPEVPAPDAAPISEAGPLSPSHEDAPLPRPTGTFPGPNVEFTTASQGGTWLFSLLFLGGLGGAFALYLIRRQRPGLPTELPAPAPSGVAPPARPTPVPELARLTDVGDQNALVWGVDHFLSETAGARIDLAESVRATARAGERPVVVWSHDRVARAIWLWLDADAETQEVGRLAEEIRTTLVANGLEVHVAWFAGLPDRLYLEREVILPEDLPTPPQEAVVAVLTDGLALLRIESGLVSTALRALRAWPRLAVVDFARGATDLPLRMRPYTIEVIEPEALARWLGGEAAGGVSKVEVDLTPWLCALALSPTPVDPADALALGARLGVDHPARHLTALAQEARMVGGRLAWPWEERALRLDWLVRQPDLLEISLDFWKQRHTKGLGDTALDRARAVERAWLTLVTDPVEAAPLLFAEPSQRAWIEEHLRGLDVADTPPRAGVVRLGWTWDTVPTLTRVMLQARGFAGKVIAPVQPKRPWKGIAACAVAALVGVIGLAWPSTLPTPEVVAGDGIELVRLEPADPGQYTVVVRTPQEGEEALGGRVPEGATARLVRSGADRDCVRRQPTGGRHMLDTASQLGDVTLERWYCTDGGLVPPFEPGTRHVVIGATPEAPGVTQLARALLELGVVAEVIFDPALRGIGYRAGDEAEVTQAMRARYWVVAVNQACKGAWVGRFALCVPTQDPAALALTLGGEPRPLLQVWPQATGPGATAARLPGTLDRILGICLELLKNPDGVAMLACGVDTTCIEVADRLSNGGRGVTADPALAARVRQHACEAGRMEGCNDLGFQYAVGKGVGQDLAEAVRLYRKACDGGHGMACYNLGAHHLPGMPGNAEVGGVNVAKAITLFRTACEVTCTPERGPPCRNGQASACTRLGQLYREGKLVPRDEAAARAFLDAGCKAGKSEACQLLKAPADAPASEAPATETPGASKGRIKGWELRGKFVTDYLIEPSAPMGYFKATLPEITATGVRQVLSGVPVQAGSSTKYGPLELTAANGKLVAELKIEPPATQLLPVLRATQVGQRVRIRVPTSAPDALADLPARVPREVQAYVEAARAAGRSVDAACVARAQGVMTDKVWKGLRILYEQDSEEAPEVRALAADPLDRAALGACVGEAPKLDPRLAEARRQLEERITRLRAQRPVVFQSDLGRKCLAAPQSRAAGLLSGLDAASLAEVEARAAQLTAIEAEAARCVAQEAEQNTAPDDAHTRLQTSLDAVAGNIAARPRNDMISAPCLTEAEARLEEIRREFKALRGDASRLKALDGQVWGVLTTMKRCLGEDPQIGLPNLGIDVDAPTYREAGQGKVVRVVQEGAGSRIDIQLVSGEVPVVGARGTVMQGAKILGTCTVTRAVGRRLQASYEGPALPAGATVKFEVPRRLPTSD